MFDVIVLFYIYIPSWPYINALCTMADREIVSIFRADRWVHKSGHVWRNVLIFIVRAAYVNCWLHSDHEDIFWEVP